MFRRLRLWLRFSRRLVPQHVRESLGFLPEPALAIPHRRLAFAVPYSHTSSMAPLLPLPAVRKRFSIPEVPAVAGHQVLGIRAR